MDNPNPDYSSPKIPPSPDSNPTCPSRQPRPPHRHHVGAQHAAPHVRKITRLKRPFLGCRTLSFQRCGFSARQRPTNQPANSFPTLSTFNCRLSTLFKPPQPPRTSRRSPSTPQSSPPSQSRHAPQPPCNSTPPPRKQNQAASASPPPASAHK